MKEFTDARDEEHGACTDVYGGPTLVVTAHKDGWLHIYQWVDHYDYETGVETLEW